MTGDVELVRCILENCRNELDGLTESGPVQGYAAEDEIEEALTHLDAAMADLDAAMEE